MVRTLFLAIFWPVLLLFHYENAHAWSSYIELGTSIGNLTSGGPAVGLPASTVTTKGFCGGLSFFVPVTSPKNFFHFELGLQNRMYFVADTTNKNLGLLTTNLAVRFEFYRLYFNFPRRIVGRKLV